MEVHIFVKVTITFCRILTLLAEYLHCQFLPEQKKCFKQGQLPCLGIALAIDESGWVLEILISNTIETNQMQWGLINASHYIAEETFIVCQLHEKHRVANKPLLKKRNLGDIWDAILNISKPSVMPEWHHPESQKTMSLLVESTKKKNFIRNYQVHRKFTIILPY